MILADTSIWIDHLRQNNAVLAELLHRGSVLTHPFIIGELALGNMRNRQAILHELSNLPPAVVANDSEVLGLIENESLHGSGIGYIDAHLLASVRLTPDALIWTGDKRLTAVAERLSCAMRPG